MTVLLRKRHPYKDAPLGAARVSLRALRPALEAARGAGMKPPPPPPRTNWTRLVPPPVLNGHVSTGARGQGGRPGAADAMSGWLTPAVPTAHAARAPHAHRVRRTRARARSAVQVRALASRGSWHAAPPDGALPGAPGYQPQGPALRSPAADRTRPAHAPARRSRSRFRRTRERKRSGGWRYDHQHSTE